VQHRKIDAHAALLQLFLQWQAQKWPVDEAADVDVGWSEFKQWLAERHFSHYLDFRSSPGGADQEAEAWFDEHFKQMRRR
jgi:hypothetical protein